MSITVWPFLAMHVRTALFVSAGLVAVVLAAWSITARVRALRHPIVDRIVMPLIVLVYGLGYLAWGEKVSHQGGYGWDGIRFGAWAKNFEKLVLVDRINHYYLQKSLPSAIVHYGMRLFGVAFTDANVIRAFGILDVASWTLTAVVWTRIVKILDIGRAPAWLGFVVLFLNHAAMKHYVYNAVLVDSFGLLLAALMFHAYVARRPYLILPLALASGFVVPGMLPLLGCLLVLFRREQLPATFRPNIGFALALVGALAVAEQAWSIWNQGYWIGNGADQVSAGLVPLSLLALVVFLAVPCAPLLSYFPSPRDLWRAFGGRWVLGMAIVVYAISAIIDHFKNKVVDVTTDAHFRTVLLLAIAKPFVSLVAHVVFLGVGWILVFLARWDFAKGLWRLGPGAPIAMAVGFVLATDNESRHVLFFLPIMATGLAIAFDRIRGSTVVTVAVIALVLSKAWLPHETPPLDPNLDPRLFMSLGPWMTLQGYGIQAAVVVLAGILLQRLVRPGSLRS